jgi:hypothetical protein
MNELSSNTNSPGAAHTQPYAGFEKYRALGLPYSSYGYEKSLQEFLWRTKRIAPERYMGILALYDEAQLGEFLTDLSRISRIVVQKNFLKLYEHPLTCKEQQEYLKLSFLYFSAPRCLHESFDPHAEIAKFIDQHYRPIDQIGDYVILEWAK